MGAELVIAVVAFIVSLIALVISLMQLTADLLATAEGRRKTSPSIMGPFGQLTEQNPRPMELRFEVHYVSPELRLTKLIDKEESDLRLKNCEAAKKNSNLHYGFPYRILDPILDQYLRKGQLYEVKGWQRLLQELRDEGKRVKHDPNRGVSDLDNRQTHIVLRQRAWDSLPDSVPGPIASTRLSDIIIIARRLRMRWVSCEARGDGMRAEGGRHVLVSSDMPGLGLALAYYYSGRSESPQRPAQGSMSQLIQTESKQKQVIANRPKASSINWTRQADAFIFGVCLGDEDFGLPNFVVNINEDFVYPPNDDKELVVIWTDPAWSDFIFRRNENVLKEIVNDLIALVCPMMRQMGTPRGVIPYPGLLSSLLISAPHDWYFKDRDIFLTRLKRLIDSGQVKSTAHLDHLHKLISVAAGINRRRPQKEQEMIEFFDNAQRAHDYTTAYFRTLAKPPGFYLDLVRAYTSRSSWVYKEAAERDDKGKSREPNQTRDRRRRSERVHLFFDGMRAYADFMAESLSTERDDTGSTKGDDDDHLRFVESITVSIVTLFFRGLCWGLCHVADQFDRPVPAKFYESEMPVFLL